MTTTFADLGVPKTLADALAGEGILEPFDVQLATIPDALAGKDLCGRAPTGSGKTLAFGIPAIANCSKAEPKHPTVLILSPTRELADQIRKAMVVPARAMNRWVTAVYGGVGYDLQVRELRKGTDILVACPGRLLDLLNQGDVYLDSIETVVVDEADQLADMGFLPDVKRILDRTPDNRQTLLFSATLDGQIAELTKRYQRNPVRHEVGEAEPDIHAMTHYFWTIDHAERVAHTRDAVMAAGPTIVFVRTRHGADRLSKQLEKVGVRAVPIHGNRSQGQRSRALDSFMRGQAHCLVATDVAARGIHVDGVACVIHFDPPADDKTYLHRSGRTARAGAKGVVVTFVRQQAKKELGKLQRELGLQVKFTDPDPSALGDGSLTRARELAAKSAPESKPASRGGGGGQGRGQHKGRGKPKGKPRTESRSDERPRRPRPEGARPSSSGTRSSGSPRPSGGQSGPKPGGGSQKVHRKGGGAKKRAQDQRGR